MPDAADPDEVLVLSWTVRPPSGMVDSKLSDAGLRLRQYLRALLFYISDVPQVDRILVFENSGYDFTSLRLLMQELEVEKRVTFVSTSTDYDPQRGKGYGEFKMYDEGLSKVGNFGPRTRLWKITGRLTVKNLASMIASAPAFDGRPSLYCDLRKVPIVPSNIWGHWMDLRLFAFNLPFYKKHFEGRYGINYMVEEGFFSIVYPLLRGHCDEVITPRFRKQPIYEGQSGYSLKSYLRGKHLLAHSARRVTRKVVPALWL